MANTYYVVVQVCGTYYQRDPVPEASITWVKL